MMIPGISLCQKWGKIRIFHSTIVALGEPRYIRFLFNPDKKGLVVQACARKEAECFRVPKYNPENWEFKISSVPMLRMIWNTCNWDKEKTYRLTGMCHIEHDCHKCFPAEIIQFFFCIYFCHGCRSPLSDVPIVTQR